MPRPVQYNTKIKLVEIPEGYSGPGFHATSFDKVVGLARKNSLWPLPFATSCCGIEFMATMTSAVLVPSAWVSLRASAICYW